MTDWVLADDCFTHDKDRLRHEEVIAILQQRLGPIANTEKLNLSEISGRILAENLYATRPIPAHDNAAVDGFAVNSADLDADQPTSLEVASLVSAGVQTQVPTHKPGTATRIFTGAIMPIGADTVLMQEDCKTDEAGTRVLIPPGINPGANTRLAGEDVRQGDLLCSEGKRLKPADMARIASAGINSVSVRKKLKIAIISTGNELLNPGTAEPKPGAVYDSNGPMLASLCTHLPVDFELLPVLNDDRSTVESALAEAASDFDIVITSGGASKGEADHLRESLTKLGQCHLWQLAIKPGRPMMMGQIGQTPVFGLPGNPVAVFICWCLYVHPAILRLSGTPWTEPMAYMVPAGFDVPKKKQDRREFYRGWTETTEDRTFARKFPRDGSGLISGLQAATGLIEIPEDVEKVSAGDLVRFIPLAQFGA